VRILSHNHL